MKKYFLSSRGQQVGPFTVNEILEKLQAREHVWNDYIYDESREDWILLCEHPFFVEKYNQGFARQEQGAGQQEQKWVIYKDEKRFGPFAYLEIVHMLQDKTLHEQDLICPSNSTTWKKVKDYQEFSNQKIRQLLESADRHTKTAFNRRKFPRAQFEGSLIVHDNKTVFRGRSFELSAGGVGIYIPSAGLQPGQTLLLHFHPTKDVPAFNAVVTVVSKIPVQTQNVRYGVKFTSIAQAIKEKIFSFTNKKKGAA